MSVNRRTLQGAVFGRGTVGSAVAVLAEPTASGVTGVGCAAAAVLTRKTASEWRESTRTPVERRRYSTVIQSLQIPQGTLQSIPKSFLSSRGCAANRIANLTHFCNVWNARRWHGGVIQRPVGGAHEPHERSEVDGPPARAGPAREAPRAAHRGRGRSGAHALAGRAVPARGWP